MSAYEKIKLVAIVSNILLWGGIVFGFVWLSITDPTVPDDANPTTAEVKVGQTDAAPRHRA